MNKTELVKAEVGQAQRTINSREVAEMVSMRHTDLMTKINGYVEILLNAKLRSVDFFIEDSYKDASGKENKYYQLTRKGCDMVANKLTGEKGVLFTAAYVTRFEEMEKDKLTKEGIYMLLSGREYSKQKGIYHNQVISNVYKI